MPVMLCLNIIDIAIIIAKMLNRIVLFIKLASLDQ